MTTDRARDAADRQLWRIKFEAATLDAERLIEQKFREAREQAAWNRIIDDIADGRTPRELIEPPPAPPPVRKVTAPTPARWYHFVVGGAVAGVIAVGIWLVAAWWRSQ